MEELQGKTAVITGAASGIGFQLARGLAAEGCRLVLADIEQGPLEAAARELRDGGAEVLPVVTDVSSYPSVQALAAAAFERFEGVHLLCNNAGVSVPGAIQDARHEDWQWIIGVNLWGVVHGVEAFLPRMIAQGQEGHIVNTASMAGHLASQGLGLYNTTKFAVVGLSETLRKDVRQHRIGVSVLCPLGVKTRIRESERNRPPNLRNEDAKGDGLDLVGRWLEPEVVSRQVIAAIKANALYVFTHGEALPYVTRRYERIKEAFPPPPEDELG